MIWLSLLIPVIVSLLFLWRYTKQIAWWELLLPSVISFIIVFATYEISIHGRTADTQYLGDLIVKAEYYESWDTWVEETCIRTYSCNCDGKGNCQTCTETYDCSYCDHNSAYYNGITTTGKVIKISENKYYELKARWGGSWTFNNLGRSINYEYGCGKDGNMYSISYDGIADHAENCIWVEDYENKVQAARSAFHYTEVTDKKGLYEYPPIYNQYHQISVLGLDSLDLGLNASDKAKIQKKFEYFNAYYGPKKKVHLFVCLYSDKSSMIAKRQEDYWKGGNQNEVVLCLGIDPKTKEIQWSRAFSWCFNHRIIVDLREDIMNQKTLNFDSVYTVAESTIVQNFAVTIFKKQFAYLEVKPTNFAIGFAYILTILISVSFNIWSVMNQFTEKDPTGEDEYRKKYEY